MIQKHLTPVAEDKFAEEQAVFHVGLRTIEQNFIEKHLLHGEDMYHNFIDFKKAFDRLCHEGLWNVLRLLSEEEGLVHTIKLLYHSPGAQYSSIVSDSALGCVSLYLHKINFSFLTFE